MTRARASEWVLVTDGGNGQGRSALAAVRALAAAGRSVAVTVPRGGPSLAGASRWCSRRIVAPGVDDAGYRGTVEDAVRTLGGAPVLAASDAALLALGHDVGRFVDKRRLAEAAAAAGLRTPESRVVDGDLVAAAADVSFPAVAKPLVSRAPAVRVDHAEDLARIGWSGPVLLQSWVDGVMQSVSGVVHDGTLRAVCHQRYLRTWPVACGTSSAAVTIDRDHDLEERLVALLSGFDGVFQAQFIGGHLLDLNPRVYGSLPLAVAAGANLVDVHLRAAHGQQVPFVAARPGVHYRWVEGDMRHLMAQLRMGRVSFATAMRILRPHRGTAHSVLARRDPMPLAARIRYAMPGGSR